MINRLVEPHIRAGWASPRLVPGGLIVLETRGRTTGRRSRVPLAAVRVDDHVVVSTFRGERSQWMKNVAADPNVRYWVGGRARNGTAHVLGAQCSDNGAPSSVRRSPAVRWLIRLLVPYTYAGWAFAVLSPAREQVAKRSKRTG